MVFVLLALLVIVVLPQLLVRFTIDRHGVDRPDLPGTGGELARHLLDHFQLSDVKVETSATGDHYDPDARAVRLLPKHRDGRSLSAVAIAAHEVGHALQHSRGERWLALRQRLARIAAWTDRLAGVFFIAAPILGAIVRTPAAFFAMVALGILLLSIRVLATLVTLPVEIDASFSKALPILREGNYVEASDMAAIRQLLAAAAFTYVAGALVSLINLARWIRLLR